MAGAAPVPFTIWEYVIPFGVFGILVGGIVIFLYIYAKIRDQAFLSVALFGMTGAVFMLFESLITILGGYLDLIQVGRILHLWQQFTVCTVCLTFPYVALHFLQLTPFWRKVSYGWFWAGSLLIATVVIASIIAPGSYLAMDRSMVPNPSHEYSVTRAASGWLYHIRDLVFVFLIAYAISVFVSEINNHHNFQKMALPLLGLAALVYGAIDDIGIAYLDRYIDFMPQTHFSRFGTGTAVFTFLLMAMMLRGFFEVYRSAGEKQERLEKLDRTNRELISNER